MTTSYTLLTAVIFSSACATMSDADDYVALDPEAGGKGDSIAGKHIHFDFRDERPVLNTSGLVHGGAVAITRSSESDVWMQTDLVQVRHAAFGTIRAAALPSQIYDHPEYGDTDPIESVRLTVFVETRRPATSDSLGVVALSQVFDSKNQAAYFEAVDIDTRRQAMQYRQTTLAGEKLDDTVVVGSYRHGVPRGDC